MSEVEETVRKLDKLRELDRLNQEYLGWVDEIGPGPCVLVEITQTRRVFWRRWEEGVSRRLPPEIEGKFTEFMKGYADEVQGEIWDLQSTLDRMVELR